MIPIAGCAPISDALSRIGWEPWRFRSGSSDWELANGTEGRLVALATAVVLEPMRGDLAAIEKAAAAVRFKYTAYRLVLALISAMPTVALNKRTLKRLDAILAAIAANAGAAAGPPLQSIIDRTKDEIENFRSEFQH